MHGTKTGLFTIAEGVKYYNQLHALKKLEVDIFQGYYFSPAV